MKKYFYSIIIIIFTILLFIKHSVVSNNIIIACNLFLYKIFPSLFPVFIISSLLINLNFINIINILFSKVNCKLFKISNNLSYILFMSMISGFPSSAKIAHDMYKNNYITKEEVQKIILYTHFANPLFIINMIPNDYILILFSHYISNFIIALIVRSKYSTNIINKRINNNKNLIDVLTESIHSSINTLLFIFSTIVLFYIISTILNNDITNIFLELSQGISFLTTYNIAYKYKLMLLGALLSFGGICIHFQVYGILNDIKIKYFPYLLSRISQALLTAFIIYLLY